MQRKEYYQYAIVYDGCQGKVPKFLWISFLIRFFWTLRGKEEASMH